MIFLIDCHDYSLTDERKQEIEAESSLFISSMRKGLEKYASDPLTNDFSYHITGTIDQADSDLWHSMRIHRITASKFKEWLSSANTAIDRFWSGSEDISNLPSIKWGREKESECIAKYNSENLDKISRCGCFISKKEINILASPDGLILSKNMVVEVKCPYNKRNEDPNVVIPDFCFYDDFGKTQLKKSHPYFYQIQCQMYVLGYKSGKFLV